MKRNWVDPKIGGLNLFWKKTKKIEKPPEVLFEESDDKRTTFRVTPTESFPIHLNVDGQDIEAVDISAGGISFEISFENKEFKIGSSYPIKFHVPHNGDVKARVKIVRINDKNICGAQFYDLTSYEEDALHHYVLKRQKESMKS